MKFLVLAILAVAAVAQAHRDWSNIKPNDIHVMPQKPAPFFPKIVGGQEANPGQFPHQVAVRIDGRSFCGGSIIRDDVILTAAHCVDSARSVEIIAGAQKIQETEPEQQSVVSTSFVVHEDWDRNALINDVALVILPQKLTLNDRVQTIALRQGSCPDTALDGVQAIVSGWGRPSDSSGSISPILRWVTNDILTNSECRSYFNIIKDTHVCLSGSQGKGSCNGDSGGPLTVSEGNGLEEIGIVSFGSGWGCEWGFPSAYTRVTCFNSWIQSNLP